MLRLLLPASQAEKVHATAGFIAKSVTPCIGLGKKHHQNLDIINDEVYQDLMKLSGVQKRTCSERESCRVARRKLIILEEVEKLRSHY